MKTFELKNIHIIYLISFILILTVSAYQFLNVVKTTVVKNTMHYNMLEIINSNNDTSIFVMNHLPVSDNEIRFYTIANNDTVNKILTFKNNNPNGDIKINYLEQLK